MSERPLSEHPSFPAAYGSTFFGALRLLNFFALVTILVPFQILFRAMFPTKPYIIPRVFHLFWLRAMGFKLRIYGNQVANKSTLFICNHTSYLDIPVLGALIPASFVAKADVAAWPMFGFLSKLQNTVFIERRSSKIGAQRSNLRACLDEGRSLILFPEGTSSDGLQALPFKSSLFSVVEDASPDHPLTVQPVSITCTGVRGLPMVRAWRPHYAWYGDMTLVGHLWDVFRIGHFHVDVVFHPAVSARDFSNRKELAAYCHREVSRGIEACLQGRNVAQALDSPRTQLALPTEPA